MNRILLTLLALLTGLTAQAVPAQAQLRAGDAGANAAANAQVGTPDCVHSVHRAVAIRGASIAAVTGRRNRRLVRREYPALSQQAVTPAVLFGADRAFE